MSVVLPTPLAPIRDTVCDVMSSQSPSSPWSFCRRSGCCCSWLLLTPLPLWPPDVGGVHSLPESSSRARLLLRDRRFLNESPRLTIPENHLTLADHCRRERACSSRLWNIIVRAGTTAVWDLHFFYPTHYPEPDSRLGCSRARLAGPWTRWQIYPSFRPNRVYASNVFRTG